MKIILTLLAGAVLSLHGAGADLKRDIEYGRAGGEILCLDASVPDGTGPFPIVILVHGGGWSRGDKGGSSTPGDSADITPWFGLLNDAKFTWFSINYRLAPQNRWPACLEDVQAAIRWVKAHAADYKGDPRRIVLFGHSAGGHLVCLAATLAGDDTRVQAVVGFAPVTDHEQDLVQRGGLSTSLQNLLNQPKEVTPESRAMLHEISPINHVKAGLPPFLIVQGDADKTVPYQQSLNFIARLKENGVPCELITVKGAPHGLLLWDSADPSYRQKLLSWLNRQVRQGE